MNSLSALARKIGVQLEEISQKIAVNRKEQTRLEQQLKILKNGNKPASFSGNRINPEQEILGLNYLLNNQKEQEEIAVQLREIHSQQEQLVARKNRLKQEHKILENYQNNQKKEALKELRIKEQHLIDERVLQQRTTYENP